MTYETAQEAFWSGEFGAEYARRNRGERLLTSNVALFARALRVASGLGSCIEFGASIGLNLRALQALYPGQEQHAIEINEAAAAELATFLPPEHLFRGSILEYPPRRRFDLVLVKGVLIHVQPEALPQVYDKLFEACGRYLLVAEYYSPQPVAIPYRGHADRLFKRDFAGELLDRRPQLALLDYGFAYHRDPSFPQDDLNWFLLERRG